MFLTHTYTHAPHMHTLPSCSLPPSHYPLHCCPIGHCLGSPQISFLLKCRRWCVREFLILEFVMSVVGWVPEKQPLSLDFQTESLLWIVHRIHPSAEGEVASAIITKASGYPTGSPQGWDDLSELYQFGPMWSCLINIPFSHWIEKGMWSWSGGGKKESSAANF